MSLMYRAIIFDFFGVIQADPYKIWLNKHGLKRKGPYAEASDMIDMGILTKEEFHRRLSELSGQPFEEVSAAFTELLQPDQTLISFIKTLSGHYKIGLLSNSRGDYLRPILDKQGITDMFDEILISSELGAIKPDPKIFELALKRMSLANNEIVFVDDRDYNIVAAEAVGIKSLLYTDLASLKEGLADLGITDI